MYSQAEYEADIEHWERHRAQLRQLFLAGQTPEGRENPLRLDGIRYKQEDDRLLKLIAKCEQLRRFSRFQYAQQMESRKEEKLARPTKGPKTWGRGHWRKVDPELALKLRQRGLDVRFLGGKDWEVFE